jgi:cysteine desulfurase
MAHVYLDNNATTPLDSRVAAAMRPWLEERFGNPSSTHAFGRAAREAVESARDEVAALLGVDAPEIVFMASGTEANNAVLVSAARRHGLDGDVVISGFEHPSVREGARQAAAMGMRVIEVPPRGDGRVATEDMMAAVGDRAHLVALMLANNELGTIQPVAEVAAECRERGITVLCDAVQAVGKIPVAPKELGVDYLTLGAHKFHGPLGAAALWVRGGTPFTPLLVGGGQERHRRASTVNVPAVVGFGEAARLARLELEDRRSKLAALRDRFEAGVKGMPGAIIHCGDVERLPGTSHVAFPGLIGQDLMIRLDLRGFAVSTGSACGSGTVEISPALAAMGMDEAEALGSVRVSFGNQNTAHEVDAFLDVLADEVAAMRRAAEEVAG